MNWSTTVKVARFHLVDRLSFTTLPWGVQAFQFALWLLLIAGAGGAGGHPVPVPGPGAVIYLVFFVLGVLSVVRSLPFAFALGVSRRSYYTGTVLLAVGLSAAYGLALALLQVIERATGGWGMNLYFFRIAYILAGPWYLTWLTAFILLAVTFAYGMWHGLVYQRWNLIGVVGLIAAQAIIAVAVAVVVAAAQAHAWPALGRFFTTTLTAAGLTGLLAALAAALLAGGYATMRRVTV
jgi:hypothetical protein